MCVFVCKGKESQGREGAQARRERHEEAQSLHGEGLEEHQHDKRVCSHDTTQGARTQGRGNERETEREREQNTPQASWMLACSTSVFLRRLGSCDASQMMPSGPCLVSTLVEKNMAPCEARNNSNREPVSEKDRDGVIHTHTHTYTGKGDTGRATQGKNTALLSRPFVCSFFFCAGFGASHFWRQNAAVKGQTRKAAATDNLLMHSLCEEEVSFLDPPLTLTLTQHAKDPLLNDLEAGG